MRNLLLVFFFGLLAVIHSSPIESMTHIPVRPEEDVLEEAMTEGFLVDNSVGSSFTTEPPRINTTVQASQQPSLEVPNEGSGLYPTSTTGTPKMSRINQKMTPTIPPYETSAEGSGFKDNSFTTTDSSVLSTVTKGLTNVTRQSRNLFDQLNNFGVPEQFAQEESEKMHNGHVTEDWIIILAFLIGLAALISLCAAIATRDKWNAPPQKPEIKTITSAQEMQTLLHKEEPKEHGKEADYTVIPLEDVDDQLPSH